MNDEVLYEKGKYKLTSKELTYHGYTEDLSKIAGVEVVESHVKEKIISGLTLSFWGLFFSFFPGYFITMFLTFEYKYDNPQEYVSAIFMLFFFFLGFMLRAKYTLYITKTSGNRGSIDKNRSSRMQFDELINRVNYAISTYC